MWDDTVYNQSTYSKGSAGGNMLANQRGKSELFLGVRALTRKSGAGMSGSQDPLFMPLLPLFRFPVAA